MALIRVKIFVHTGAFIRVHMIMKSHEKSWNLRKHFPDLEKSWILGKMAEVMEFHFWPRSFVLFANWKHFPCHRAKICPNEKAEFSAFLNHGHRKVLE